MVATDEIRESAVAGRGIPFWEFEERVQSGGFKANAVTGMWNWLALTFCVVKAKGSAPAKCEVPLSDILNLTPAEMEKLPGVGPARFAVYEALYESLRAKPAPLPLPGSPGDITREGLSRFAAAESDSFIGQVWNRFIRTSVPGFDRTISLGRLEAYCNFLKTSRRFPTHHKLLLRWLAYLKQHQ